MARNASGAGQVATLGAGRRSRTSGPVRDPSASQAPAAAATTGAHTPLQVAFTNAALSIAFVLQQNMVRQQQQITLMNSFAASQQFQSAAAGVFPLPPGHIQQQPQQQQESLYPLQPLLAAPAVAAALPQPTPAPILSSVGAQQLPQQQSYFVHAGGHPLQGGDLYAAMTAQTSPYIEALPAPATVVLPKTDCNANNNVQL